MISLVFRYASDDWNASSEDIEYKVRHVTVSRWSSGPLCGIHSGDPSEHGRNAAGTSGKESGFFLLRRLTFFGAMVGAADGDQVRLDG